MLGTLAEVGGIVRVGFMEIGMRGKEGEVNSWGGDIEEVVHWRNRKIGSDSSRY